MTSFDDLVVQLSDIHVTDLDHSSAIGVAENLIAEVLKDKWHHLSECQKALLVRPSATRLWDAYMHRRKHLALPPEEAARIAIDDELVVLEQALTPE
jgi:hypothetical protein